MGINRLYLCYCEGLNMKPYNQGNVDFFCSIYAIINSIRRSLGKYHRFTFKEGCRFYQYMIQYLYDNNVFIEVLYNGCTHELMQDLLGVAKKYLKDNYNLNLHYKRPFMNKDISLNHAINILGKYLSKKHSSAIMRFYNTDVWDHYSVVEKKTLTTHKLKLFDSYFYPYIDIRHSTFASYKNDKLNHISKEGIIFIRITKS